MLKSVTLLADAEVAAQYRDEGNFTVVMHDDFFEWFSQTPAFPQQKRARRCLRELLVAGVCARRKNVKGAAKGRVRTQLSGTAGSHYYLWWAPYGYPAVDGSDLASREVLVRLVRHHDQTGEPLDPGSRSDWHALEAAFVHDDDDSELTDVQRSAAAPTGPPIRIVQGFPGSGKTTALLHAASRVWGPKALFVTFSSQLALASRQYLQTFAPQETAVDCLTFGELMGALSQQTSPLAPVPSSGAVEATGELHLRHHAATPPPETASPKKAALSSAPSSPVMLSRSRTSTAIGRRSIPEARTRPAVSRSCTSWCRRSCRRFEVVIRWTHTVRPSTRATTAGAILWPSPFA